MTGIEAARTVTEQKQCHLLRPRKDDTTIPQQYDAKPYGTGSKRGWFYLDLFTASAIVKIYDAINDDNKAKYSRLPITKQARIAFQLLK